MSKRSVDGRSIGRVFVVSVLVADRLCPFVLTDGAVKIAARIFAPGFAGQRQAPFAKAGFEETLFEPREIADLADTASMKRLFRPLADAGNLADIKRREILRFIAGRNPEHTIRLGLVRADFSDKPRRSDADRTIQF